MDDDKFQLFMHLRADCPKHRGDTPIIDKIVDDFMAANPTKEQFIKMIDGACNTAALYWAVYNR